LKVLDLPQIHTRPDSQTLLSTLSLLTSTPPSWDCSGSESSDAPSSNSPRNQRRTRRRRAAPRIHVANDMLPRYLTSIIASDLRWIPDEDVKEEIWEQASVRLSERSGRSAMPALTRKFRIPRVTGAAAAEITIHEPALTSGNLGWKTWASSHLLAKRMARLHLPAFFDDKVKNVRLPHHFDILELGAGTGLVGIAAAAILGVRACLTDLPDIVKNLASNVEANHDIISAGSGHVVTSVLDWTAPNEFRIPDLSADGVSDRDEHEVQTHFPVILAADPLYSSEHPQLLVQTIDRWLSREASARVVVELPLRDGYRCEVEDFRSRMRNVGLRVVQEAEEIGYDDWGHGMSDRPGEVRCWWSMWSWETKQ
ncbi:putative methyltransferase-domain-containing protein, partial [Lineolata rhizophorae]